MSAMTMADLPIRTLSDARPEPMSLYGVRPERPILDPQRSLRLRKRSQVEAFCETLSPEDRPTWDYMASASAISCSAAQCRISWG